MHHFCLKPTWEFSAAIIFVQLIVIVQVGPESGDCLQVTSMVAEKLTNHRGVARGLTVLFFTGRASYRLRELARFRQPHINLDVDHESREYNY